MHPSWRLKQALVQAEDRAHRIGQPSSVNVYFLHVKQSVDDIMWNLIQNKLDNVGQVFFHPDCSPQLWEPHGQRTPVSICLSATASLREANMLEGNLALLEA